MNRIELEQRLIEQRGRRTLRYSHRPARAGYRLGAVGVVLAVVLAGLTVTILYLVSLRPAPSLATSPSSPTYGGMVGRTPTLRPTYTAAPATTATDAPATRTAIVCAGVTWLHVRFAPSPTAEVRGYLRGGETVRLAETRDGWARLTSPIEGWVNEVYLCDSGERP